MEMTGTASLSNDNRAFTGLMIQAFFMLLYAYMIWVLLMFGGIPPVIAGVATLGMVYVSLRYLFPKLAQNDSVRVEMQTSVDVAKQEYVSGDLDEEELEKRLEEELT